MKIEIDGPVELTLNDDGSADIALSDTSLHLSREIVNSDMKIALHKLEQTKPSFVPPAPMPHPWTSPIYPTITNTTKPELYAGTIGECTGFGGGVVPRQEQLPLDPFWDDQNKQVQRMS